MAKGHSVAEVKEILEAAAAPAPTRLSAGGYSPLFLWMWKRHDALAPTLNEGETAPNWQGMAEAFATKGVLDGSGKPPTPETVRKTWWKVDRMKREGETARFRRRRARSTTKPDDAGAATPPSSRPSPVPKPAQEAEDEEDLTGFTFARPKQ